MKYSLFSIVVVLFLIKNQDSMAYDLKYQEEIEETSQNTEYQENSPRYKNVSTHFLFQMHDAINSLHTHYLRMLRNGTFLMEQNGVKQNISDLCIEGIKEISNGLKEKRIWSLMMIDSCGKIPSGILEGNFYSIGDYDQCIDVEVPGKFQGQYCEIGVNQNIHFPYKSSHFSESIDFDYLYEINQSKVWNFDKKFPNGLHPVTTSICLPSTCSMEEVKVLISKVSSAFEGNLKMSVSKCITKFQRHYTNGEKLGMILICIIIVLEITATIIDFYLNASKDENVNAIKISLLKSIALSLSLRTHCTNFFKKDSHPASVKIFNGIRLFSILLIIVYHNVLYNLNYYGRSRQFYIFMMSFPGIIWQTSILAVDSTFFISGFLVLYINIFKSRNSTLNLVHYILKRYLRHYIPVLFIFGSSFFFLNMNHGPNWYNKVEKSAIGNRFNWWKNALCINNFSPTSEQFLHWTWYLAADMQLHVFSYFILLIYRKYPVIAVNIVKTIIVAALVFLAINQHQNGYPPSPSTITTPDKFLFYMLRLHYPTYFHIAPYLVGMLTCHIVLTKDVRISKVIKVFGWFLSITFGCIAWFLPNIWHVYRHATTIESVVYGSLQKFLWSLVLAWITVLYFKKEGGFVVTILSWKGFSFLRNLTFMAYLIQSPVIKFQGGLARHPYPFSYSSTISSSLVVAVVTFFLALIAHLVCEAPCNSLLNLLFKFSQGIKEVKKNQ